MKKISCAILYSLLSFSANVSSETVNEMDVQSTDHLHYSTYILVKRGCFFYGYSQQANELKFQAKCGEDIKTLTLSGASIQLNNFLITPEQEQSKELRIMALSTAGIDWDKITTHLKP